MSYRLPFIAGASASIFVGLGYIAVVKTDAIPLDYSELVDVGIVKILTGGAVIAVVCQVSVHKGMHLGMHAHTHAHTHARTHAHTHAHAVDRKFHLALV